MKEYKGVPIANYYGQAIIEAFLDGNLLKLRLDNGELLRISDDAQNCCEMRWMSTDDDLSWLVGKKLTKVDLKEVTSVDEESTNHDIAFLEIMTDQGCVTLANHNAHNGYYEGFEITMVNSGGVKVWF